MLSYMESGGFVVAAMLLSIVIVAVLNRAWPTSSRKLVNDVTGWQLGILGTTYGVILGFMLFTVWNDFRGAEVNANMEASALLTVSRIAAGLPSPEREAIHALGLKYAETTIHLDWPAMQMQGNGDASEGVVGEMWKVLAEMKSTGSGDSSADHLADALKDLSERRNLRAEELRNRLPGILWLLLMAGAGATVGSSCLLGNDNKWLHYCQVLALTFVVSVALASIADLARPFEGAVSVTPVAFERALAMMQ
ncbi:MAG TPA: hypothetical protein VHW70_13000 [Edaphobacter sp.]|jgi:hypothetical protein|nr:hypothetical protein [Edaphobacter sp.]